MSRFGFFILRHRSVRSAWSLACVSEHGIAVAWSENFPEGEQDQAVEWLALMADGVMSSAFAWSYVTESDKKAFDAPLRAAMSELLDVVRGERDAPDHA